MNVCVRESSVFWGILWLVLFWQQCGYCYGMVWAMSMAVIFGIAGVRFQNVRLWMWLWSWCRVYVAGNEVEEERKHCKSTFLLNSKI